MRVKPKLYENILVIKNQNKEIPVKKHFNMSGHSLEDIKLTGKETNLTSNRNSEIKEAYWVTLLTTITPHGISLDSGVTDLYKSLKRFLKLNA